jgi:hypothetical protein
LLKSRVSACGNIRLCTVTDDPYGGRPIPSAAKLLCSIVMIFAFCLSTNVTVRMVFIQGRVKLTYLQTTPQTPSGAARQKVKQCDASLDKAIFGQVSQ